MSARKMKELRRTLRKQQNGNPFLPPKIRKHFDDDGKVTSVTLRHAANSRRAVYQKAKREI